MPKTTIVVPCFDEAERFPVDRFRAFVGSASGTDVDFLLVDDGSRDRTLAVLKPLESEDPARFHVLALPENRGKAEAVRAGMCLAMDRGAEFAGYFDADLATPLSEIPQFQEILVRQPTCQIVLGSRVKLLGKRIERNAWRHYFGRVFATVASILLELPVYDTQCGAKLFRVSDTTRPLFAEPFATRWVFDVELIARLIRLRQGQPGAPVAELIIEKSVDEWLEVPGSKVRPLDFARAIFEMGRIHRRYLGARARREAGRPAQVMGG